MANGQPLVTQEDVGSVTQKFKNPTSTRNTAVEETKKYARMGQVDATAAYQAEISRCG
jgi:hypothetical protein